MSYGFGPGSYSDAYEAGKARRIRANARVGRARRFDMAYPGLRQRIQEARPGILPDWIPSALIQWGGLTDKQATVALNILENEIMNAWDAAIREEQRRMNAVPWTAGRQIVEGKVLSVRWSDIAVGYNRVVSSLKALVIDGNERKLWTTIPTVIWERVVEQKGGDAVTAMKGETIRINVTVQPKDGDVSFAFGKRPTVIA